MDEISEYDRTHVQQILNGEGTWFSAHLLRLIAKADRSNLRKIEQVYPKHVEAYHNWYFST